ncbi:MAG TPA: hypothetical protein VF483_04665 [Gemmatimonadaceae bacterium]
MSTQMPGATRAVGFWAALFATAFSISYDLGQVAEWLGWLGSAGGPESMSTPLGIAVLLLPSLLLAPSFVLMLVAIDHATPDARRVWTKSAVAMGIVYAVMISINYYVQLALVMPRLARGDVRGIEPFLFVPFDSFLYAVDVLGYSFMSAALLLAAMAFPGVSTERRARWFMIGTGALIPFLLLQMYWHPLIWFASAWAVTFPGATWAIALMFRRASAST